MVNIEEIQKLLKKHFTTKKKVTIDPQSGAVSVVGDVLLKGSIKVNHLPVTFDRVGGDFFCEYNQLQILTGVPHTVQGNFHCEHNQLTSLQGAPNHVGGGFIAFDNNLLSLDGLPSHIGGAFQLNWNDKLPLLRCLALNHVMLVRAPDVVSQIMNKYMGQGKTVMLNCALELKQAGYEGNAKW